MKPFLPLSADASEQIRDESLAHYHAAVIEAESTADAALADIADFRSQGKLWRKGDVEKLAALTMIAHEAERALTLARHRLLKELCDAPRSYWEPEDSPPWN